MESIAINNNKSFSSERFSALMKADFALNKSNYLKLFIGGTGVFVAVALLVSVLAVIDINSLKNLSELTGRVVDDAIKVKQQSYGAIYTSISIWIYSIGLTVLGSLTFSNLSSKRKRISALMIPASRVEKFTLRVLVFLFGGIVALLIGFFIGTCICQIVFGGGWEGFKEFDVFIDHEYSGSIISAFILMTLLGNSIYALGSALWPKLSWIKTWVIMMILQWIGTFLMIILSTSDISWYSFFSFWAGHISFLQWSGLSALAILNIACWVLAWVRYRNTQIVQRFMTK